MEPKVSIIIPLYNAAMYIERAVNMLNSQDSDNFEVIFVNDGSVDNSLEILDRCTHNLKYPFTIISQSNGGVSKARNTGLSKAKGKYICFCDIDDFITENYVSALLSQIETSEADVALSNFKIVKNESEYSPIEKNVTSYTLTADECLELYLRCKLSVGVCGAIIRRDVIEKNIIRFAEGYKYSEDLHFMWRILCCCESIAIVDGSLYFYFWDGTSATSVFDKRRFDGYKLFKDAESFVKLKKPSFYYRYSKFVPSRLLWSIARQASSILDYKEFKLFFKDYPIRQSMCSLLQYPNVLVKISSLCYIIHPYLFYLVVGYYGKRTVNHAN